MCTPEKERNNIIQILQTLQKLHFKTFEESFEGTFERYIDLTNEMSRENFRGQVSSVASLTVGVGTPMEFPKGNSALPRF